CTGSEYFPALEAACDAANHEIYLETYIFEGDATGLRIAQALMRAARRGVTTHLLIDGFGSKGLGTALLQNMRDAGVRTRKFRPQISPWTLRRERLRRLHCKLAVIDAKIAFVGGINIIDDMHTPNQTPPRFDYAVRVEGPLLADIHPVALHLWVLATWTEFHRRWRPSPPIAIHSAPCGAQRAAFLIRDNLRHRRDVEHAYLDAIANAKEEIVIACAYFFPGRSFRRALIDAAARRVRVVLMLQGRVEYVLLYYAARALYGQLLGAGIEIYEYHRSFLHAKVAVIDRRWATVGSSNIDPMSLLLAREANVVIDDAGFALKLQSSLNNAMETGARRLRRGDWERHSYSLTVRTMTWICYQLVRFLSGWSSYGRAKEFQ
ncbi:MAG TPA: cardiolipin synthase ClsB, partial [Burkholderiales bacterium]|nr:cardiolipin synthase ClsB [Burkholderiales bacterium]